MSFHIYRGVTLCQPKQWELKRFYFKFCTGNIHYKDAQLNPELYKVNQITLSSMKVNFGILLSGNREEQIDDKANIASIFPSESDIISSIIDNIVDIQERDMDTSGPGELPLNEPCVVWDIPAGSDWFAGMVWEHLHEISYLVEHLERHCVAALWNVRGTLKNRWAERTISANNPM